MQKLYLFIVFHISIWRGLEHCLRGLRPLKPLLCAGTVYRWQIAQEQVGRSANEGSKRSVFWLKFWLICHNELLNHVFQGRASAPGWLVPVPHRGPDVAPSFPLIVAAPPSVPVDGEQPVP